MTENWLGIYLRGVAMGAAALAVLAVAAVATLLLGSPAAAALVLASVACTALGVVGAMGAWGVRLNALSTVPPHATSQSKS